MNHPYMDADGVEWECCMYHIDHYGHPNFNFIKKVNGVSFASCKTCNVKVWSRGKWEEHLPTCMRPAPY